MSYERSKDVQKELKTDPILDNISKYKSISTDHVNKMQRYRFARLQNMAKDGMKKAKTTFKQTIDIFRLECESSGILS